MIGLLAAMAVALTTPSGTPAPTRTPPPPVDVVGCVPVASGSGLLALFTNVVRVNYVSRSPKTIRFLQFRIDSGRGVVRFADDPGLRRKNDVVEHEITVESGALGIRAQWTCSVAYALFNDGSTYGTRVVAGTNSPAASSSPSATPAPPPINILACDGHFDNAASGDWDVTVGVTFENTSAKVADVVKFELQLVDAFGKVLHRETGTMYGTFSQGAVIRPQLRLGDNTMRTQPEAPNSPAWSVSNPYGHDVNQILCAPAAVHYADGSTWTP